METKNSQVVSGVNDMITNPLAYPNGLQDPNNMVTADQAAGGKTKIQPTDQTGADSRNQHINGEQVSLNGEAPNGANSSGIPEASHNASESGYATGANTLYDENNTQPR